MNNIPISLAATPATTTIRYANFNEFLTLVAQYLVGSISANVSFFLTGTTPPTTNQGVLFYNTSTGSFYAWNTVAGAYTVVGINQAVGDIKFDYDSGDQLSAGWVLALGSRTIDSITAMSANQNLAAHGLFGAGAAIQIPNVTAPVSTVAGGGGSGSTLYPKIFVGLPIT